MTTPPNPHPSRPQPYTMGAVDLEAIARRVFARDRGEPLAGPYRLRPEIFDSDRDLCLDAQERLVGLLRACGAFQQHEAALRPDTGSSALLSAALDLMGQEVAAMPPTAIPIIKLAEAEKATTPLDASEQVDAVLDAHGSSLESMEAFMTKLVSAMKVDATVMPVKPAKTMAPMGTYASATETQAET
ncbi:MAG: hypothetical protein ACR2MB_15035 [Acidimicrobiales bacterium]